MPILRRAQPGRDGGSAQHFCRDRESRLDLRTSLAASRAGQRHRLMNRVMDPVRWKKLQDLFAEARALQGDARKELLQSAAREDPDLVEQVRSLLQADSQTGI